MLAFSEISLTFKNERSEKKLPGIEKVWEYLEVRGISRELADRLGLHIMQAVELIASARRTPNINAADNRAAIVFPHYRLGTDEQIEWWSSRLVALGGGSESLRLVVSFGDAVPAPRMAKMFCPPNEAPHAYLCPPQVYDWGKLERGQRVYIHESAIKSINGSVLGYASIGLNGVWGWGSKKHGIALVEELRDIPWKGMALEPVIVFDSNGHDNVQVQHAAARLAAKLFEVTGRESVCLFVPKRADGSDRGFDDYVHEEGKDAGRAFLEQEGSAIDIGEFRQLMLALSDEVCIVRSLGRVAEQATGTLMSRQTFVELNYAHYMAEVEDGDSVRRVSVPKTWLTSPERVEVEALEYAPGKERLVVPERGGLPNLNLWRGMGIEPEGGDVTLWLELLTNNVQDEFLQKWLLAWCAYPLQNLGAKVKSFPLIFGPSGVGKDLWLYPLHLIYGENAVKIGTDNLKSSFNSLYSMRQFVHIDELERCRDAESAVNNKIKGIVTDITVAVNKKGQPEYTIKNVRNPAITSNYWDCVKLDQDDRRAAVIRWEPKESSDGKVTDHRGDQPYWQKYVHWIENERGAHAIYQFLLDLDISWFDPNAWAPDTPWKSQVKEATMTDVEIWVKDLWENTEEVLGIQNLGKALFTSKELCVLCFNRSPDDITRGMSMNMSAALRNRGFAQAADGGQIRAPGGIPERWWVVRERTKKWSADEAIRHLRMLART